MPVDAYRNRWEGRPCRSKCQTVVWFFGPNSWLLSRPALRVVAQNAQHERGRNSQSCQVTAARYAVIGAGFAGLATAYHLLDKSPASSPIQVHVFDAGGVGAGGSGAAAGLLHPFTPKGKLLWKAPEAIAAAQELLAAAEGAAQEADGLLPLSWATGMIRPAATAKQSKDYYRQWRQAGSHSAATQQQQQQEQQAPESGQATVNSKNSSSSSNSSCSSCSPSGTTKQEGLNAMLTAQCLTSQTAADLLPGLLLPAVAEAAATANGQTGAGPGSMQSGNEQQQQQQKRQRRQQRQQQKDDAALGGWSAGAAAALYAPWGITLHPQRYMAGLWAACQQLAAARARSDGCSRAALHVERVHSLQQLLEEAEGGSWDGVAVCAGAGVGTLGAPFQSLPLDLCQGYTLDLTMPENEQQQQQERQQPDQGCKQQQRQQQQAKPLLVSELLHLGAAAQQASGTTSSSSGSRAGSSRGGSERSPLGSATSSSQQPLRYPVDAPSILGQPYLASQGGQLLVLGASKDHGWSSEAALELGCAEELPATLLEVLAGAAGSGGAAAGAATSETFEGRNELHAAAGELAAGAVATWPPVAGWQVAGVRSGVRALPPRGPEGSVPLVGRWQEQSAAAGSNSSRSRSSGSYAAAGSRVWLCVGLGARGLVYHAWLGALVAKGLLEDTEEHLSPELLRWRQPAGAG